MEFLPPHRTDFGPLKSRLSQRLAPPLTAAEWDLLAPLSVVREAAKGVHWALEDCVAFVKLLRGRPASAEDHDEGRATVTRIERERAEVLARRVANEAARDRDVRRFRSWLHGDPSAVMPEDVARAKLDAHRQLALAGVPSLLGDVATRVADRYGWGPDAAVMFVLAGIVPQRSPVTSGIRFFYGDRSRRPVAATMTLNVQIGIASTRTVEAELLRETRRARAAMRGPGRPRDATTEAMARWVDDLREQLGQLPAWKSIQHQWNSLPEDRRPPNWRRYGGDWRHMLSRYRTAMRAEKEAPNTKPIRTLRLVPA